MISFSFGRSESLFNPNDLRKVLQELALQPQRIYEMADAAHRLGETTSGAQIIAVCENVVRKHRGASYAAMD